MYLPRVVNPGSILARFRSVFTTSSLFIYNCKHLSIKFWTCNKYVIIKLKDPSTTSQLMISRQNEELKDCLTSSISSRETFLLSLPDAETEPASATGVSAVWFCWSFWASWEAWIDGFFSVLFGCSFFSALIGCSFFVK